MSRTAGLLLLSLSLATLAPAVAAAQDSALGDPEGPQQTSTEPTWGSTQLGDEQALLEEETTVEHADDGLDPRELENHDYFFVGLHARALVIPSYPFDVANVTFPNGYSVPVNGNFGAYFNYRRNGFNIQLEISYQSFYWDGYIVGANDSLGETENIHSELGVIFGWFGFSWSIPIVDWFAVEIGLGLGVGGTIGNLWRTEAFSNGGRFSACEGPGNPVAGDECDASIERPGSNGRLDGSRVRGGTYQRITGPNPFYFGEGGVPPIFATIDIPRVSFRFKPIRQVQLRIDTAFNLYGVTFGASAGYGF